MDNEQLDMVRHAYVNAYSYAEFKAYCEDHGFEYPAVLVHLLERWPTLDDEHLTGKERATLSPNLRWTDLEQARHYPVMRSYVMGEISKGDLARALDVEFTSTTNILTKMRKNGFDLPHRTTYLVGNDELLQLIIAYKEENDGNSPSLSQMAKMLGVKRSAVFSGVNRLIRRGVLTRNDAGQIIVLEQPDGA